MSVTASSTRLALARCPLGFPRKLRQGADIGRRCCPPIARLLHSWNAWRPSSSYPTVVVLPLEASAADASHWLVPAAAAAFMATASARAALCDVEDGDSAVGKLPNLWRERVGSDAQLLHFPISKARQVEQADKSFVRQTCTGPRMIEQCQIFECAQREDVPNAQLDEPGTVPGQTRVCVILQVGDALNGHPQTIHGGFTAAVLDDIFGLVTMREKDSKYPGEDMRILTANLHVNYRRPLPSNKQYLVEVETIRIVRDKKVYLKGTVYDAKDRVCVESTSLYILKRQPPS